MSFWVTGGHVQSVLPGAKVARVNYEPDIDGGLLEIWFDNNVYLNVVGINRDTMLLEKDGAPVNNPDADDKE